jgi:hypothetical protein
MAKRVPEGEKPYNPVEASLVRAVILGGEAEGKKEEDAVGERNEEVRIEEAPRIPQPLQPTAERPPPKVVNLPRARAPVHVPAQFLARGSQAREKRVLLTHPEERELELLVNRVALELNTPAKLSHLLRACITLLRYSQNEIIEWARQAPPLSRPPNGSPQELAEFEYRLAQLLQGALKAAPPL